MSKKPPAEPGSALSSVRVERAREKPRRHTHAQVYVVEKGVAPKVSSMSSDYVYVNSAYMGSVTNVNETRAPVSLERPTSVIREQYWTCSKWPYAMRILLLAVGVLFGAVLGLTLTIVIRNNNTTGGSFGDMFATRARAAPD